MIGKQLSSFTVAEVQIVMTTNIKIVNNTGANIDYLMPLFNETYATRVLHPDLEDVFTVRFVSGLNPDGTDRMIIDFA